MARLNKKLICNTLERAIMLALLALLLALLLLSVVNDMYAFVKPSGQVRIVLNSTSLEDFSQLLQENGIVKNPHIFSLFVKAKKRQALVEGFSGELLLDRDMSYREIMLALS